MKVMKVLVTTLVLILGMTVANAQSNVAIVKSKSDVTSIRDNGKGMISLPSNLTAEDVQSKAKYYTHYFTVNFDAGSHVATITMVENDERSRSVIYRFLLACDVKSVKIEGAELTTDEFYSTYIK